MPMNLGQILEQCRLCQLKPGTVQISDNEEFVNKVFECTKIELNTGDQLFPKTICASCKHCVDDFFAFVQETRLVDQKLHQQLSEYEDAELSSSTQLKNKVVKTRNVSKRLKCPACSRTYARVKNLQLHERGHVNLYCSDCELTFDDSGAQKTNACSSLKKVSGNDELEQRIVGHTVQDDLLETEIEVTEKTELKKEWFEDEFPVKNKRSGEFQDTKIRNEAGCINALQDNLDALVNKDVPLHEAYVNRKNKFKGCEVCNEQFTCNADLRAHHKIHRNAFPCSYGSCKKMCSSAYSLRTHLMRHEGKTPFLCVTCGKGFTTKNSLNCHEKTHATIKGYACKECNIGFSVASNLRAHQKKHHEGVRFYCSQCTRAFITKCSLERHELVHTGVKEFKCQSCRAAFYTNKELLKHQRYHQGLRLYKCDQCFKTFFEKHHLTIHIRVHTGERPYACKVIGCGKSFAESQKLSRHIKARHAPV